MEGSVIGEGVLTTYPDIVIILYELRMSEQTPLQHGLHHSQVHHVEEEEAQDGQVDDNRHLQGAEYLMLSQILTETQKGRRLAGGHKWAGRQKYGGPRRG